MERGDFKQMCISFAKVHPEFLLTGHGLHRPLCNTNQAVVGATHELFDPAELPVSAHHIYIAYCEIFKCPVLLSSEPIKQIGTGHLAITSRCNLVDFQHYWSVHCCATNDRMRDLKIEYGYEYLLVWLSMMQNMVDLVLVAPQDVASLNSMQLNGACLRS